MAGTNLNDVCAFCYKCVEESVQLGNHNGSQTVPKFCKFLERICGKRFNVSGLSGQLLATCEACVSIIDSFNGHYHQVQCLQLQMEWKLDKLKNVMKMADKIQSRLKAFRERYDIPRETHPNETLYGKEYKQLVDTRNAIQLQMAQHLSSVFPHVRLKNRYPKSIYSNLKEKKVPPSHLQEPRLQSNNNPYFALQWFKTVIGLTMCCLPTVHYQNTADPIVVPLKNPPEIVFGSDVVSEPEAACNVYCASLEVTNEKRCPDQLSTSIPSSPGSFGDANPDSPISNSNNNSNNPMDDCRMEGDDDRMNNGDESSHSNVVSLEPQVTVLLQKMETEDNYLTNLHQPFSISDAGIICIADDEPEKVGSQLESLEQSSVHSSEGLQDQKCTNLQVAEGASKLENEIPTRTRKLRPKFKCKSCSLTFSTSNRLNEHSKSCTSSIDFNESEDENSEEDVGAAISDNDSNFDENVLQTSENECKEECPLEEDSGSDFSNQELDEDEFDIKPKPPNKVKRTKTRSRRDTDSWSLEECLEIYKKTNGQTLLSEQIVSTLKLTSNDIQLKGFESLVTCKLSECDSGLFSKDELEYHQSLHGLFKCYFCEFSSNFAIQTASHEVEHNSNLEIIVCPRCPGLKIEAANYKKHFVDHHLEKSISYRCAECPVCSMPFPETDQVPLVHFVNEHDVSRLNDPAKVFDCNEDNCSAYFLTVKQLLDHTKIVHNKTKRFWYGKLVNCLIECDICSQKFPSGTILRLHKNRKHGTINDFGLTVITNDGLTINNIYDNQNANVPCLVKSCNRVFCTEEDRDAHSKHHGTFKCNFCSVKTKFAPDLAVHELEHANAVNIAPSLIPRAEFKCSRCTFSNGLQQRYIDHHIAEHLKLSPDEVTITCPICQQIFATTTGKNQRLKEYMFRHFVTHHDKSGLKDPGSPFNCALCPAYFLTEAQLHVHNNRAHPEQTSLDMDLICDDCHLQFRDRAFLLNHRTKDHHNNDESSYEFICETENCNKRFEYRCDLERHHLWHSSERLNSKRNQERVRQKRKHQELVCKQCVKTFPSNSRLAEHMLFHSGPESWDFTCDICLKKCPNLKDLSHHRKTHPNTSNYLLSGSLDECLEKYKNTNGKLPLSQKDIETLKLSGADIALKSLHFSSESCYQSGCAPGLYSNADLEYHRSLHGKFQCSFCEYNSSFAINLIEHELEHSSNLKNGLCPKCPELKVDKSDYKLHFVESHLETSVTYRSAECPVCSKSFPESDQVPLLHFVNEHDVSRLKDPEKVFSCNEDNCSAYFLTAKQLIAHSKEVHNKSKTISKTGKVVETRYACDICPSKFLHLFQLKVHKKKRHTKPTDETKTEKSDFIIAYDKYSCNSCKRKFFTEEDRSAHSKLHGNFKCEFCPVTKSFAPDLAFHEIRMHSTNTSIPAQATFNCSRCEFSSNGRETCIRHHLENHLNFAPETFTVKCPICKQLFKETWCSRKSVNHNVIDHFLINHDKTGIKDPAELFNCVHCPAYFLALTQLQVHKLRMHPEQISSLSLSCTDCNRQFRTRRQLLIHRIRVHHNHSESDFKFICQVDNCSKRFEYECDLERHIAWHRNFSPKPCPECGKVLLNQGIYDIHVKTHQGHVCEQCGKKFKHKEQLTVHMAYHGGPDNWQFTCDICSRKCPSKSKLMEHKKVHSNTKPYICDKCGATYAHRHNWRHHMIKIHGVPDFTRKTAKINMTSRKGMKDQQNLSSRRKKRV